MTIILFLVDTSASMNQRTYIGTSSIDVAKASVETFMKIRSRDPNSRWDRYMLLTFEDPPSNVKAGWKESHATFMSELKNLEANGLSSLGPSLKHSFDLLNLNRMQSGIDTYGQGRCPFYLEPAVIIVITDGGRFTSMNSASIELNLPMNSVVPGSELTKEPFRWDQRIFGMILKLPGCIPPDSNLPPYLPSAENHPLDVMCDVTGGRSYVVPSQKMLNATIESLVQKVQSGVVLNFEKIGPDPPQVISDDNSESDVGTTKENNDVKNNNEIEERKPFTQNPNSINWQTCRRLIYVPRSAQKGYSVGHWPIPEGFWPDMNSPILPARTAQPIVKFSCAPSEPLMIDNLPFDKYELEPSPLTQFILERRQPNTCWQVFVSSSAKYGDAGHPFGYMKASSSLACVNLFVLPYNYPVLLPLLDELFKVHKLKPTPKWRQQFENYLKTMPGYYAGPLKRALARMGAPNLVPDNLDNCLSYSVITYLKKLKNQAKMEMDRLIASVGQKGTSHEGIKVNSRTKTSILQRRDFNQLLQSVRGNLSSLKQELTDYNTFTLAVADKEIKPQCYRNAYDIPRRELVDQISRMRTNFLKTGFTKTKMVDEDIVHSVPVSQMGNYQEYLKKQPSPLRELETQPVRLHMFGNPFKVNKQMMVDETEDAMFDQPSAKNKRPADSPPTSPQMNKRKPGPIPKDFIYHRPSSPALTLDTPPTTPVPSSPPSSPPLIIDLNTDAEENDTGETSAEDSSLEEESMDSSRETSPDLVRKVSHNHIGQKSSPVVKKENEVSLKHNKYNNINIKDSLVWTHNTKLRHILYKEIKKPGRNYENLFNHLNTVQGNLELKRAFIDDIVREAGRFKKTVLVKMLEQFEQSLIKTDMKRNRASSNAAVLR